MKLPQYIIIKKQSYYFQKGIPSNLRSIYGKAKYVRPLGLKVSHASLSDIEKARLRELDNYELLIKTITNTDLSTYSQDEITRLAQVMLRDKKISPGSTGNPEIMSAMLPEIDGIQDNIDSLESKVTITAYKAIADAKVLQKRTLDSLYNDYISYKGYTDPRMIHRVFVPWRKLLSICGNQVISNGLIDTLYHALDTYVEQRLNIVSPATIKRELNTLLSILNRGSRKYRLGWMLQIPQLPNHVPKEKQVLTQEQQSLLIQQCLSYINPRVATCVILMLQGGMMPSEIKRLKEENLEGLTHLNTPFITITADTKTKTRKRLIPIVLHSKFIIEHINNTIDWLNTVTDSAAPATLKKFMTKTLDNGKTYTGHCLRHSFRNNAVANSADLGKASLIAGWSTGGNISTQMLNYGSEGLGNSEVVKGLFAESLVIHKHLIISNSYN